MKKVGFLINPIAGMGGSVALKGTDGEEILEKAKKLGAKPKAHIKASLALKELLPIKDEIEILTSSNDMGEKLAKELGFKTKVVFESNDNSTSEDTIDLSKEILKAKADLLLFAGGDGTARDVYRAVGEIVPVIGIPSGVKIHSPIYAINPKKAGILALKYLKNEAKSLKEVEVVDIDEKAFRNDVVKTTLYGYLKTPYEKEFLQNKKAPTPLSEELSQKTIAIYITDIMEEDTIYLIGPGSTTREVMKSLNLPNTLLGVDIIKNKKLLKKDASEKEILETIKDKKNKLIITPTGGQGYLLGRGNQQISSAIVKHLGKNNIIVISTLSKIIELKFNPLYVDTGDLESDNMLKGPIKIITGYKDELVYSIK